MTETKGSEAAQRLREREVEVAKILEKHGIGAAFMGQGSFNRLVRSLTHPPQAQDDPFSSDALERDLAALAIRRTNTSADGLTVDDHAVSIIMEIAPNEFRQRLAAPQAQEPVGTLRALCEDLGITRDMISDVAYYDGLAYVAAALGALYEAAYPTGGIENE